MKSREEIVKARTEFKNSLKTKTPEQLKELLNQITEESKTLDEEVSKKEFKLPKNQKEVFEYIKYFINRQKVKWNYALGLITIYEFFDKEQSKITFAMLDTVLRMLGSLEFEGYEEWKKVVAVNDYFKPVSEEYANLNERILDIADKYAAVDQTLQLHTATPSTSDENTAE